MSFLTNVYNKFHYTTSVSEITLSKIISTVNCDFFTREFANQNQNILVKFYNQVGKTYCEVLISKRRKVTAMQNSVS